VGATYIIRLDFQPGNRISTAVRGKQQAIASLVPIGLLGAWVNTNHAPPDNSGIITEHIFVEQVAPTIWSLMSLLSVVGECLSIGREGRPIHFARCPSPRKHDILMNVCQSGPDATNRPLERPIAINAPFLMCEMPSLLVPILQLNVTKPSTLPNDEFHRPNMKAGCRGAGRGGLFQQGGLGSLFKDDKGMAEIGGTGLIESNQAVEGCREFHIPGHVQHRAPREKGCMPCRESIGPRTD
jgi:hypothetical protein